MRRMSLSSFRLSTRPGRPLVALAAALWLLSGCSLFSSPPAMEPTDDKAAAEEPAEEREVVERVLSAANERNAVYFYLAGQLLLRDNNRKLAEKAFAEAAKADPEALQSQLFVARLATQRGDFPAARKAVQRVIDQLPDNLPARLLLAGVLNAEKRYEGAVKQYQVVLEKDPDNLHARVSLAQTYGRLDQMDRVREALQPLEESPGRAWQAHLTLGRILAGKKQLEKALGSFKKAFDLKPGHLGTVLALGAAHQELKQNDEAEKVFRAYLSVRPDDVVIRQILGDLLLKSKNHGGALKEFRTVARLTPDSMQARLSAVIILLGRKEYSEALQELRLAEAVAPRHPGVLYYLGVTLESVSRPDEAYGYYERIAKGKPFHKESQLKLSLLDAERQEPKKGVKRIKVLVKDFPGEENLYVVLSYLMTQAEDYQGIIDAVTEGLKINPDLNKLIFNRAVAYDKLDRWGEAEKDLQHLISKNPNDANVLNYLGYSWADRNIHLEKSHELLKKAVALAPNDGFITDSLGWALFRLKRLDESLKVMRRAVRLVPTDPVITEHLGDVLEAVGKVKEAVNTWKRSLELDPKNDKLKKKIQKYGADL